MITILIVIAIFYIFSLKGRTGHPGLQKLQGWAYAHRGLHGNGVPENSMTAFRKALESGYGIELDVHLLADGNLAVIHDSALVRTTGAQGKIEDLTTEQLSEYKLEGTDETIPTFRQVLDLYDGKAPLIVEMKSANGNHGKLTDAVCKMLSEYNGAYCIESFDPRCVSWLRKYHPEVVRGQLSENFFKSNSTMHWILKLVMSIQSINLIARPDFVAYRFADRKNLSVFLCRKLWKLQGVTWTLRSKEDYDAAVQENWLPIFEGFEP